LKVENPSRFAHIDSLRGIAALLVVWLHVCEVFVHLSPETEARGTGLYEVARMVDFGRVGVTIFFLISGFVICKSLKGDLVKGSREFLIRRFFRLYPAFWLSIALGLCSIWWLYGKPIGWQLIAANVTMLPEILGQQPIMGLYWTLEVELVFYFLCWLLFLTRSLDRPLTLFLVSSLLVLVFVAPKFSFTPADMRSSLKDMPYNLSIMFFGGLLRQWNDDRAADIVVGGRRMPVRWLLLALCLLVMTPALLALTKGLSEQRENLIRFGNGYTVGFLVFFAGHLLLKIRNRLMVGVGVCSYSIYLVHPVVFYTLLWYLQNYSTAWLKTQHLSVYLIFTMVLSTVLGAAIYRFVEKPAIDHAHRLTR
jgi:peptidoglycan/LPS O-acetylase OafA/YrhL